MSFIDYYNLLQISSTADADIINAAYRKLATRYHPDAPDGDKTGEKMKQLNEAREILINPKTREQYDRLWQLENENRERLRVAKLLLREKKYLESKSVLSGVDHPTARKWLAQIEEKLKVQADGFSEKGRFDPESTKHDSFQHKHVSGYPQPPRTRNDRPPVYRTTSVDDLAEERIRRIQENENARLQQIRANADREYWLREQEQNHKLALIQTYERIGERAFQVTNQYSNDSRATSNRKAKAWSAIKIQRYESARSALTGLKSTDRDISDWLILVNHILQEESLSEKLSRLGIGGVLTLPLFRRLYWLTGALLYGALLISSREVLLCSGVIFAVVFFFRSV